MDITIVVFKKAKIIQIQLFHIENTILILEMKKVEETTNMILLWYLLVFVVGKICCLPCE